MDNPADPSQKDGYRWCVVLWDSVEWLRGMGVIH